MRLSKTKGKLTGQVSARNPPKKFAMLVCHERMGLCKCIWAFNTLLLKQKLLQLVLWNK